MFAGYPRLAGRCPNGIFIVYSFQFFFGRDEDRTMCCVCTSVVWTIVSIFVCPFAAYWAEALKHCLFQAFHFPLGGSLPMFSASLEVELWWWKSQKKIRTILSMIMAGPPDRLQPRWTDPDGDGERENLATSGVFSKQLSQWFGES